MTINQLQPLWLALTPNERESRRGRLQSRLEDLDDTSVRQELARVLIVEGKIESARLLLAADPSLPDVKDLTPLDTLDRALALAVHPLAPPAVLARLATNWGEEVASRVGANPMASPEVILGLSRLSPTPYGRNSRVFCALSTNPVTPMDVLTAISKQAVKGEGLANPAMPLELFLESLGKCLGRAAAELHQALHLSVSNPACPTTLWELAAVSKFASAREALIKNPAAPDELKVIAGLLS